nr:hypothetical protein CFP56_67509 [Quercus suber]
MPLSWFSLRAQLHVIDIRAEEYRFIKLCNDTEATSKSYESSDNIRETGLILLYIFALGGMGLNVGTVFSKGLVFLCFT